MSFNEPGGGIQQRYKKNKRSENKLISPSIERKIIFLGKNFFFRSILGEIKSKSESDKN